jgi:23S rRNA (uracil1939-C5)-methyltransferase
VLPQLLDRFHADKTTALLDPPRKGCLPVTLQTLCRVKPRQIIYVSCHPATMARDLKRLCEDTYQLRRIVPLDMFPQTQHVECVADLRLAEGGSTAG